MKFLWEHKLLTLLIILGTVYWLTNKPQRFGIVRNNLVVYNRIPIMFLDLYVDPDGKKMLLEDMTSPADIRHWWSERGHRLTGYRGTKEMVLVIGTGFDDTRGRDIPQEYRNRLLGNGIEIQMLPTRPATRAYNARKEAGRPVAVLLKTRD